MSNDTMIGDFPGYQIGDFPNYYPSYRYPKLKIGCATALPTLPFDPTYRMPIPQPLKDTTITLPEEIKKEEDIINHPSHYNKGKFEVIDIIEDCNLGFHLGNAIKYILRAGHKNPEKYVEDLEKAIWYINREIKNHA